MAQSVATRSTYPRIPNKNWWDLRRSFVRSIPKEVTSSYLATALEISDSSAQKLIRELRSIGLLTEQNQTTPLAGQWRDDELYASACQAIREVLYPSELLDLLPPPEPDRRQVQRWFARQAGSGEENARQMGALYLLLCEADPKGDTASQDRSTSSRTPRTEDRPKSLALPRNSLRRPRNAAGVIEKKANREPSTASPTLHLTVQIHISPEATSDQIEQVFSSMRRHFGSTVDVG
jgi:hypothetical protein